MYPGEPKDRDHENVRSASLLRAEADGSGWNLGGAPGQADRVGQAFSRRPLLGQGATQRCGLGVRLLPGSSPGKPPVGADRTGPDAASKHARARRTCAGGRSGRRVDGAGLRLPPRPVYQTEDLKAALGPLVAADFCPPTQSIGGALERDGRRARARPGQLLRPARPRHHPHRRVGRLGTASPHAGEFRLQRPTNGRTGTNPGPPIGRLGFRLRNASPPPGRKSDFSLPRPTAVWAAGSSATLDREVAPRFGFRAMLSQPTVSGGAEWA